MSTTTNAILKKPPLFMHRTPNNAQNTRHKLGVAFSYLERNKYLHTSIFSPELLKHYSRHSPSLNLTALSAVLRITTSGADMSNYENKQIPPKCYLVSKLHGSEVRNCRDQRVFLPARHDRGFAAQFSPQTTGEKKKKPSGTQGRFECHWT